jgi:hypothetical protein
LAGSVGDCPVSVSSVSLSIAGRASSASAELRAMASKLLDQRHIGDFTRWKDQDSYRKSFERVLRDLTMAQESSAKANPHGAFRA